MSLSTHKTSRLLLGLLVGLEALLVLFLILDQRYPRLHDGFQYFALQYYFLNNAVMSGEIPQWLPFMIQGTAANWWYEVQAGFVQQFYFLIAPWLHHFNFLTLFHVSMFWDQILLLSGTWFLSKRLFEDPSCRFFITLTVSGTSLWMDQPWYNFHFFYALPWILECGHRFLQGGRWRHVLLAGNLAALQMLGGLPYMLPVVTLIVAVYFSIHLLFVQKHLPPIRFSMGFYAAMATAGLTFLAIFLTLKSGTDQIASYHRGRNPDGTASLISFLTYATNPTPAMWKEILLGVSPGLDYTLYMGYAGLAMVAMALVASKRREQLPFLGVFGVLLFFSQGGYFSYLIYKTWPMMKYYRHLSLVAATAKLFLCFLAGFGLETVIKGKGQNRLIPLLFAICFSGIALWLYSLFLNPSYTAAFLRHLPLPNLIYLRKGIEATHVMARLAVSIFACGTCAGILLLLWKKPVFSCRLAMAFSALQFFDILAYRLDLITNKTLSLSSSNLQLSEFQHPPYPTRRTSDYKQNPRALMLEKVFHEDDQLKGYGAMNWAIDTFRFHDTPTSMYRTDYWMLPFDDLLRATHNQPLRRFDMHLRGLHEGPVLEFPATSPSAQTVAGITADKIRVFDGAETMSDFDAARLLGDDTFDGNSLLLSTQEGFPPNGPQTSPNPSRPLESHPFVLRFDANHLDVGVYVEPTHLQQTPWLYDSDVWHPLWHATVNGRETPVFKANLAYRAVPLQPGFNMVRFSYGSPQTNALYLLLAANVSIWVIGIVAATFREIFQQISR